jgi:hypothetical protein
MYHVYMHSEQAAWWLKSSGLTNYTIIDDFEQWCQLPDKISIVEVLDFDRETKNVVAKCCQHSDQALLFLPEFVDHSWCQEFDLPNVVFFIGGQLNYRLHYADVHLCPYFFWSTTDFYRTNTGILPQLAAVPKTHQFDVLLGRQKPHRTLVHQQIDHSNNIVTYFPTDQDQDIRNYNNSEFVWPSTVLDIPSHNVNWTVQEVLVNGIIVSLSQIVPVDIYNQTNYTLVAETQANNEYSFFTEKIVKPIIARRLFVVVSGQYYLQNLRSLGFKTFNTVIDEGYDNEPDLATRVSQVLEQVLYLSQQDPVKIYADIDDILTHNHNLMMNHNWQKEMCKTIANCVNIT